MRTKLHILLIVVALAIVTAGAIVGVTPSKSDDSQSLTEEASQKTTMTPLPPTRAQLENHSGTASEPVPTGPELSLAEVRAIALAQARLDARPEAANDTVTLSVARGEAGRALETMTNLRGEGKGEPNTEVPYARDPVFLVVIHGDFRAAGFPIRQGEPAPTGTVLSLAIDAHSGSVETIRLGEAVPTLGAVGPVVDLSEGKD